MNIFLLLFPHSSHGNELPFIYKSKCLIRTSYNTFVLLDIELLLISFIPSSVNIFLKSKNNKSKFYLKLEF